VLPPLLLPPLPPLIFIGDTLNVGNGCGGISQSHSKARQSVTLDLANKVHLLHSRLDATSVAGWTDGADS